jgi:exodeoxyribonuclease V beta subunit
VLRLESDAELVKVITVHKSKGLEYPLVYLPFAVTARKVERRNRSFFEFSDDDGVRRIDMALTETAMELVERARLQEDLRLLYVALTRARHFLWLGVTALGSRKAGENTLHESALGYLLTGGEALPSELMMERWEHACRDCGAISIEALEMAAAGAQQVTRLSRVEQRPPLLEPQLYAGALSAIGRSAVSVRWRGAPGRPARSAGCRGSSPMPVPRDALQEKLLEGGDMPAIAPAGRVEDAPWHRFPRGSVPGNFLHEQLEWMGQEGFRHRR